jgi:hypothetical protein
MNTTKQPSKNDYSIGDLVKWYLSYADDPDLIKDAGIGLITSIQPPDKRKYVCQENINVSVYRFRQQDVMNFSLMHIIKINKEAQNAQYS